MTLSNQNKILLFFSIASTIICVLFIIGIICFFMKSNSFAFYNDIFTTDFSVMRLFTETNSLYVIISLLTLSIYVPTVGFIVYVAFEKTNSSEVVFFTAMLFGFFAETFRLAIPIFSLEKTYSLFLRTICDISFFGQMLVILSIIMQGAFTNEHTTRETDKLLGVISITSLCFTILIPVNYSNIKEFYSPIFEFQTIFEIIRLLSVIITFGAMLLSAINKKSSDEKLVTIGFFIIIAGYMSLLKTTMLLTVVINILCLLIGTFIYLKHLYSYYMWK